MYPAFIFLWHGELARVFMWYSGLTSCQLIPVTPTALTQRAGVSARDCKFAFCYGYSSCYNNNVRMLCTVQKWNSILQAVYGGATLAVSREWPLLMLQISFYSLT